MVKHVYICDKCGKEMTEDEVVIINQHGMFDLWVLKQNEICKDCFQNFRDWIEKSPVFTIQNNIHTVQDNIHTTITPEGD